MLQESTHMTRPPLVFTFYIAAPIEKVWDGFVSAEANRTIFMGAGRAPEWLAALDDSATGCSARPRNLALSGHIRQSSHRDPRCTPAGELLAASKTALIAVY